MTAEDGRGELQIIWPWTWYYTLRGVVEDDVTTGELVLVSMMFWFSFDKIGRHPIDQPPTQMAMEENDAC